MKVWIEVLQCVYAGGAGSIVWKRWGLFNMRKVGESGFTLIELLVTLAIAVILMALAAPSFRQLMTSTSLTSQTNEFMAALNFTRSEAVKRNVRVTLCKSAAGTACTTGGGWHQGWIIFVDAAADGAIGTVNTDDVILRVHGPLSGGNTLVGQVGIADYIAYLPNGQSAQSGRWDLCGSDLTVAGRDITLGAGSGYPAVVRDELPLTCDGS